MLNTAGAKPDMSEILNHLAEGSARVMARAEEAASDPVERIRNELGDLKESYKAEGRAYAKELGGIMTERILADRKVNDTLDSVRYMCWGIILYLTLISLLLFGTLYRLRNIMERMERRQTQLHDEKYSGEG